MNTILIHLGPAGWLATYQGPHAGKVVALFDSATIPTPFTSLAPIGLVISSIRNLNPGVRVQHWLEG